MRHFFKKNAIVTIILCSIFVLALLLRTVKLSQYPVGFQIDEASLGYNAYSILKTGKGEAGDLFPLYISTFNDFYPSGYIYLGVLPVKIFGLTEFSTRLPAAFFGALTIFPIYLLAFVFTKNKKISLLSSLLVGISPWHIMMSRGSAETLVALFFVISGFSILFYSLNIRKGLFLFISAGFLAASYFIYHVPRVFIPTLLFTIAVFYYPYLKKYKKFMTVCGVIFIFLVLLDFYLIFFSGGGTARFKQVSVFNHPEEKLVLAEQLREDGVFGEKVILTRIFHNKITNYSFAFIANYLDYFSPNFLVIKGGLPIFFSIERMGVMYLFELPFLIYGLFCISKSKRHEDKFLIFWLLLAPITAAITIDDIPNVRRSIMMIPALEIIAAYGIVSLSEKKYHIRNFQLVTIFKILIACGFIYSLGYFLQQYFVQGKMHRPWYRNNGFASMMTEVNKLYNKYDKVVMTKANGGYPLVLFYSQFDPNRYHSEGSPKDPDYGGFGKFIFVPQGCPSNEGSPKIPQHVKILYVDLGSCKTIPVERPTKTIYKTDSTPAFKIVY